MCIYLDGTKLHVRISYNYESFDAMKSKMWTERQSNFIAKISSSETIQWLESNDNIYVELCESNISGAQLTADSFAMINYPPNKYDFVPHFKEFQNLYGHKQGKMQIYYDKICKVLYALDGANMDNIYLGGMDVTNQVHLLWRFVFLKDNVLSGQDSEFNIYKSYIFNPHPLKLMFSFVAILVQLVLTVAMCYDILDGWPFVEALEKQSEYTASVIYVSILVFILLSISTNRTTSLFFDFYENIGIAFHIPWYFIICDFLSNIVISTTITLFSFLFLLTSESYTDLVLNAFALTFVSEIDDFVNTFESDEDYLLQTDLRAFLKTDCSVPRVIEYKYSDFIQFLWSPFGIFISIWTGIKSFITLFVVKKHRNILKME